MAQLIREMMKYETVAQLRCTDQTSIFSIRYTTRKIVYKYFFKQAPNWSILVIEIDITNMTNPKTKNIFYLLEVNKEK